MIYNKKFAIFGVGINGARCFYLIKKNGGICEAFITNERKINEFCGVKVLEPGVWLKEKKVKVLIAVNDSSYWMISRQLINMYNLIEFEDFIWYESIFKELVYIHGNCHVDIIKKILNTSKAFREKYAIYPNISLYNNTEGHVSPLLCRNMKLWIHQDIREDGTLGYGFSDEYIRSIIADKDVEEIIIPNLFKLARAFFPQSDMPNMQNDVIDNGKDTNGIFPYIDKIIDDCMKEGMSEKDIIKYCKGRRCLSKKTILNNFKKYMNQIKKREKKWDVKIYRFIKDNYKKKKLFYDEGHPTNIVLYEISRQILQYLKLDDKTYEIAERLDSIECPVYPIVKKVLGIKWNKPYLRESGKRLTFYMDFDEYIREYIFWKNHSGYREEEY